MIGNGLLLASGLAWPAALPIGGLSEFEPAQDLWWSNPRPGGSSLETLANGLQTQGRWSRTVHRSPRLGPPVAVDIQDLDRAARLLRRERLEPTHAQTSRGRP